MGRFNNRYKRDMKQTAVEWLANSIINLEERLRLKEINLNDFIEEKDLLVEQAKEMEKEQKEKAYEQGSKDAWDAFYEITQSE
jgi:hypothetical protein